MSDWTLAATGVTPFDPYGPMAKLAQINQANVQTQGGQIANQGAQLGLQLQQARLAPFLPAQPGSSLVGGGGTGGLGSLAAPGAGGAMGADGAQQGGPAPQQAPTMPGDIGERVYGFAMPPMQAMSLAGDKDPTGSLAKIADTRRQLLYSAAAQSSDPQSWNQNVAALTQQGWLSSKDAHNLMGRFDLQPRIVQSLASPDANLKYTGELSGQGLMAGPTGAQQINPAAIGAAGAKAQATASGTAAGELPLAGQLAGARAGATSAAQAPYQEPIKVETRNPDGSTTTTYVPRPAFAGATGGTPANIATGAVAPAALNSIPNAGVRSMATNAALQAGLPPEAWPAWISAIHNESGWNTDIKDGAAGEIGIGQIKPGTGALVGYTPQQLRDPQTNMIASAKYFGRQWTASGGDPAGALRGYNGGNPGVVAAQPYADRAVQRAQGWAAGPGAPVVRVGAQAPVGPVGGRIPLSHADEMFPPDAGAPAPATPAALPAAPAPVAPPPGLAAIPGAISGGTTMPLQQQEQMKSDVAQMGEYRKDLLTKSQAATQNNAVLGQMQAEAQNFQMGKWADVQGDARAMLDSVAKNFGIPESQEFTSQVGSQQAFMKNAGQLARTAAREVGSRTGAQELAMIQKTLPSDEMSPQAFQRVATQLGGVNDFQIAKSASAAAAGGNPNAFEASWSAHVSPTAFIVNRMPAPDLAELHTNLMKTPEGRATWQSIRSQVAYAEQNRLFDYVH